MVSKKVSYGKNNSFKCFIRYNENDIIRPLFVKLPQITSYINKFKDKNGNDDNNYIKTKIKTFKDSIITNFHNKKVPEEKIYKFLSIILLLKQTISIIHKHF